MTNSKIFLLVMCLASAAGGAIVVSVATPSTETCAATGSGSTKADHDYFSREVVRSPKQGF